MANRYISIKVILDDILEHPLLKDLTFERAINHTVHFIRILGCPDIFNEKVERVEIKEGLKPGEEVVAKGASIIRMAEVSAVAPPSHTHNH